MNRTFISYSSSDKVVADQICATLEQAGYKCWIAPRDIEPGAEYAAAILSGLEQTQALVVIITASATASPHILSEVEHAFDKRKPIIQFRLSTGDLPPNFDYFLSMSQWLDAHDGCTSENLARLTEAVSQALSGKSVFVPKQARPDRRVWIAVWVACAALLAVIAALAYWLRPAPRVAVREDHTNDAKVVPPVDTKPVDTKPQPWVNPKDGLTYVWIPPGTFTMGCSPGDTECQSDESPSHLVELPQGFRLGQTEVTTAAYHRVFPSAPFHENDANLPAVNISWQQAKAYCAAVDGRLPAEAEWEYAARGGVTSAYYGVPANIAWYAANSGGTRHPVAGKTPNAYGLYDVLGNASEWVLDRYYNKYDVEAPAIGKVDQPLAPNASALTRGGYWDSNIRNIRVSRRAEMENDAPGPMAGIRCAIDRN